MHHRLAVEAETQNRRLERLCHPDRPFAVDREPVRPSRLRDQAPRCTVRGDQRDAATVEAEFGDEEGPVVEYDGTLREQQVITEDAHGAKLLAAHSGGISEVARVRLMPSRPLT